MTPRPVLVLQHVPWEHPGLITAALAGHPVVTRTVVGEASPDLPDVRSLAGVVVMGGPMNADDDARYPGLAAERRLLAEAVDVDVPVLGICLGMQLLARALGARVHAAHGTEIGLGPVDVVASDPVLDPLGARPTVLHWHGDAPDLPAGATLLASTPTTPVQAFRAGSALGLQFHLEVDPALLAAWLAVPQMAAESGGTGDLVPPADPRAAEHLAGLTAPAAAGLASFAQAVRARSGS